MGFRRAMLFSNPECLTNLFYTIILPASFYNAYFPLVLKFSGKFRNLKLASLIAVRWIFFKGI